MNIKACIISIFIVFCFAACNNSDDEIPFISSGNHGGWDYWIVKMDESSEIQWQKCFGGSDHDKAQSIQQTSDRGYIVVGNTESNDGDVSGIEYGNPDAWIIKMDESANIQWKKSYFGFVFDASSPIQQTTDKGYILVGASWDCDVQGSQSFWVVKLRETGVIQWKKCYGGGDYDNAYSVQQTADGGYIVAGHTESNDGDVSGNHGFGADAWIIKLDKSGVLQWQKCLGGSNNESAYSIQQTSDGGYIVVGSTDSDDGDVSGIHGSSDVWIAKLDVSGNLQWQKCLGGSNWDDAYSIQQTSDGGYIIAGWATSNDGDVSGNQGGNGDAWIVKLHESGNILWQKCLGGSNGEGAYSIQQTTDGGYIVAGWTESNDGDVSGNHENTDYWVVKLDVQGSIQWQKCLGGSGIDRANSIQQTKDGGYIIAGESSSNDGDVAVNQ